MRLRPAAECLSGFDQMGLSGELKAEEALRAEHGFDVAWLDRSEIAAQVRLQGPRRHSEPGRCRGRCVSAHARRARRSQSVAARACTTGTDVTKVRDDRNGVTLTTNRGRTVRARRLVVAAGYEVARQLRQDRGHLHSTWAFVSEPFPDLSWWPDRCLIWETRRPYLYLRTTMRRTRDGGRRRRTVVRLATRTCRLMASKTERLLKASRNSSRECTMEVAYAWAGVFGTTPDGLPYIGTLPEHPQTCFALGYGGNGITFSAIAARTGSRLVDRTPQPRRGALRASIADGRVRLGPDTSQRELMP